ncbi:MAG: hypothetical protein AAFP77_05910 [Bacteroidota bacterium]
MSHIAIPIPKGRGRQEIEVEITINGEKQQVHYKVELFYWEDCEIPTVNRVECIRNLLNDYDHEWALYYIGEPNEEFIPITFIRKEDWERKRQLKLADL